jgi:hypothetical protein
MVTTTLDHTRNFSKYLENNVHMAVLDEQIANIYSVLDDEDWMKDTERKIRASRKGTQGVLRNALLSRVPELTPESEVALK